MGVTTKAHSYTITRMKPVDKLTLLICIFQGQGFNPVTAGLGIFDQINWFNVLRLLN